MIRSILRYSWIASALVAFISFSFALECIHYPNKHHPHLCLVLNLLGGVVNAAIGVWNFRRTRRTA